MKLPEPGFARTKPQVAVHTAQCRVSAGFQVNEKLHELSATEFVVEIQH
jgi:hypothetical protein